MKITQEHLQTLQQAVSPHDTAERRKDYREGRFKNSATCKNVNMRYRWDLLYMSKLKIGDGVGMSGLPLYQYMNDVNIDSALKHFIKDL